MPSILNDKQFNRLDEAIVWSQRQLEFPRKKRIEAVKLFLGSHYAEDASEKRIPVPYLALAVIVTVRQLVARAPRAMFTSIYQNLRPVAATMQLAINKIPDEIKLATTLRRMVTEAMFSPWGVVKVGLHTVGKALGHEYGESFVDLVTFDDFFIDMSAKSEDMIDFEGNDYWLDYDELMEYKELDKESRRFIKPDEMTYIGPNGEDRADAITTGSTAKTFKDKIKVRDVFLPDENIVLTYAVTSKRRINIVDLDGPPRGPYHKLSFIDVPSEVMALPPVAMWRDLHELANSLFRKLGRQADGQKTVLGFDGSDDQGVSDFKAALDGDGIKYTGREPKELKAGGVNRETLAFEMHCRDLFSYFAGNLDTLGGLAPVTETVGQDRMLSDAVSAQTKNMADKVVDVEKGVYTALAYYEWHDPIKRRKLEKPIPGTDMTIEVEFGREHKVGEFSMYDLSIDVFSAQDDSPSVKLQKLGLIVDQYIIKLDPLIQRGGGTVDVKKIFEKVAEYAAFPEVTEFVVWADVSSNVPEGEAGMPQHTTREYVRRGEPGQTRQGASAAAQQILLGGGVQNAELPG